MLEMTGKILNYRKILLGVSGGIAAYKSPDLVRRLKDAGADVRVVMTRGAQSFVTPLTFQAVSGGQVHTELLDEKAEAGMGHIELARWADLVLVVPASADFLARLAHGLADDLLSTLCLATRAPIAIAPAMNQVMWANSATEDNINLLQQRGIVVLGPAAGDQACGEVGPGRMLEPLEIVDALSTPCLLQGVKVMVTAGPTREAIDPVRYLSNRSSGRMGYEVARAARAQGADVVLISGPVSLRPPEEMDVIQTTSGDEMHRQVLDNIQGVDIFISTAAVSDYRVVEPAPQKIKKSQQEISLNLIRNKDILADVAALDSGPFTVGFAAETENLLQYAKDKLQAKGLDMIAANQVGQSGTGFDAPDNELLLLTGDNQYTIPRAGKREVAAALIQAIAKEYGK